MPVRAEAGTMALAVEKRSFYLWVQPARRQETRLKSLSPIQGLAEDEGISALDLPGQ